MRDSWRWRRRNPIRPINRHYIIYIYVCIPSRRFVSVHWFRRFRLRRRRLFASPRRRCPDVVPHRKSVRGVGVAYIYIKGRQLKRIKKPWRSSASGIYIDGLEPPRDKRHDSRAAAVFHPFAIVSCSKSAR